MTLSLPGMTDPVGYLRRTAQQCRSFARWHCGTAADHLHRLADEFDEQADALQACAGIAHYARRPQGVGRSNY